MILWHNPRCTKSRETLKLLQDAGHQPAVRLYLKEAPSAAEIIAVRNALGVTADAMMRKGEKLFKELGLGAADEDALIAAMVANPILIERPILITDDKAAIGRPPESVLGII
ncbi:arsenate reductase (glutaredoxin) [Octadecabacter sp. 1_MG-2023]|uniref:arsenate reductase (glutaredoxin) n=1 Tax=unclassified Octadecabacter TaxID=196158 RepID=UPI001C08726E|nr:MULTISPECIES: arsenate reductase (glutaredoxin) [unclassified Octadecabacter]MBU2994747.1 arsenate reductase (glutaredoxin) [Octadecabacter sp. B2R22]MDO6733959.1 arsenate reductase (glutaredoxin) [Octadecabacter sp. 1_MG-2023]